MYDWIDILSGKKVETEEPKEGVVTPVPTYDEIYEAYFRSFVLRDGCFIVGNHRMIEGFNVAGACESFARYKHVGCCVKRSVVTIYNSTTGTGSMCVKGGGCFLNSNIPERELQATFINLISQLRRGYDANIKEVLTERIRSD